MESRAQVCPGVRTGQEKGIWDHVEALTHSTRGEGAEPTEVGQWWHKTKGSWLTHWGPRGPVQAARKKAPQLFPWQPLVWAWVLAASRPLFLGPRT